VLAQDVSASKKNRDAEGSTVYAMARCLSVSLSQV